LGVVNIVNGQEMNAPNIIAPLTSWLIALKCVKPVKAVAVAKQKKVTSIATGICQ